MHRLKDGIYQLEDQYRLPGSIEIHEGYFTPTNKEDQKLKRGRGRQRKKNIAVMAESTPLEEIETGNKSSHFRFVKMKVLDNHTAPSLNDAMINGVKENNIN